MFGSFQDRALALLVRRRKEATYILAREAGGKKWEGGSRIVSGPYGAKGGAGWRVMSRSEARFEATVRALEEMP